MPSMFNGSGAVPLASFPGFGVKNYDLTESKRRPDPFFEAIIAENLRILANPRLGNGIGIRLLESIRRADPAYRHNFPARINVIFKPIPVRFVQGGYRVQMGNLNYEDAAAGNPPVPLTMTREIANSRFQNFLEHKFGIRKEAGLPMTFSGLGAVHEAMDQTAASNGQGTVCAVDFSNARVPMNERPYIYLAHELIHCLHSLTSTKHPNNDEPATIGLGGHEHDALTENRFLDALGLQRRTHY